jgi:hypothetical protein
MGSRIRPEIIQTNIRIALGRMTGPAGGIIPAIQTIGAAATIVSMTIT